MKTIPRFIFAFCLVLLVSVQPAAAQSTQTPDYSALVGIWEVDTDADIPLQFIFKIEDKALTGALEFEMGGGTMESITFVENQLTFFVNIDAGGEIVGVEITARIEEDKMSGTIFTDMGDLSFTGIKKKEK